MQRKLDVTAIDQDELRLKKTVFIGYTDMLAAGSRALLGIGMRVEYYDLHVPEVVDLKPACVRDHKPEPTEQNFKPIQVLNCMYEEFSLIVINTLLPSLKCHYVANKILELCTKSPDVKKVVVLSAARLDIPDCRRPQEMYENTYSVRALTDADPLPDNTYLHDPVLSTLLQMLRVINLPFSCIIVPSYRGIEGAANMTDGSVQAISAFHDVIEDNTRLKFDRNLSLSLLFKGKNDNNVNMTEDMYR